MSCFLASVLMGKELAKNDYSMNMANFHLDSSAEKVGRCLRYSLVNSLRKFISPYCFDSSIESDDKFWLFCKTLLLKGLRDGNFC